jgi:asparagine synthase (glutamine-hydrolysing)
MSNSERVLSRLTSFMRQSPGTTIRGEGFLLARWSLGLSGRVDVERQFALAGFAHHVPAQVGIENASRLGGDYALISGQANGLLLARGRHAGRCLYFAQLPEGAVAASSRLEPLLACLTGGVAFNVRTLAALMLGQPSDDLSATVFREVRRVEASQAMVLASTGILERTRAAIEVTRRDGSPDELAEEIRQGLDRAIRRSIEPTRRVAVLVSGGVDSSSVLARAVAIARGASRPEVDAVTWSFAGPGDDRPYLTELCDALGIVPLRISSADVSARVVPQLVADAAPSLWPARAGMMLPQERARERGADAILTGMGGDQIFDGDPRVFAQHAREGKWGDAIRSARRFYGESFSNSLLRTAKLLVPPRLVSGVSVRLRMKGGYLARQWPWAGPLLREMLRDMHIRALDDRDWTHPTSELRFQRLVHRDLLHVAESRGQVETATGLMRIDPLLDDELVSTVAGFPQEALLFDHRYRGLFRHAMRQSLPERLRLRPDKARFGHALTQSIRGSDVTELRRVARMQMSGDLGLVEPRKFIRHFEATFAKGDDADWAAIWPALTVEAFVRKRCGAHTKEGSWQASA